MNSTKTLTLGGWGLAFCLSLAIIHFRGVESFTPQCIVSPPGSFACDPDCQQRHGAVSGACNGANNCICSGSQTSPSCTAPSGTCQCADDTLPLFTAVYGAVCQADCQCNHGSEYGTCNFDNKICGCGSSPNFVWDSTVCTDAAKYLLDITGI